MPITKCEASKATPLKGITYIMDKEKMLASGKQLILADDPEGMAAQMLQTMHLHGKGTDRAERKYYHTKVSFDPADLPENGGSLTPEIANFFAAKYAMKTWPGREVVWSVQQHEPGKPMHIHFITAACEQETGKKLDARDAEYRQWKTRANTLAAEMGLSKINWEKAVKEKRQKEIQSSEPITETLEEQGLKSRGKTSWKDELREKIDSAIKSSSSIAEFKKRLEASGVTLTRYTDATISYKLRDHKACRGDSLGGDYTVAAVRDALQHNKEHPAIVDPNYRPSLQAKLTSIQDGARVERVISLEERQMFRDLGRLAGMKRSEVDDWCDYAPKASWEEKQQVWNDYLAAKAKFWNEYSVRQQALRNEIDEAYQKRRIVKNMEWALNPRNRRSSLIGVLAAGIFMSRNDTSSVLDEKIKQLKKEQEALRNLKERFKAQSESAVRNLREKGLTIDAYVNSVKGMQDIAENIYQQEKYELQQIERSSAEEAYAMQARIQKLYDRGREAWRQANQKNETER